MKVSDQSASFPIGDPVCISRMAHASEAIPALDHALSYAILVFSSVFRALVGALPVFEGFLARSGFVLLASKHSLPMTHAVYFIASSHLSEWSISITAFIAMLW